MKLRCAWYEQGFDKCRWYDDARSMRYVCDDGRTGWTVPLCHYHRRRLKKHFPETKYEEKDHGP